MEQNPELAWGLIASMYLGNMALLAISIFAIPLFVQMIKVPYRVLGPDRRCDLRLGHVQRARQSLSKPT